MPVRTFNCETPTLEQRPGIIIFIVALLVVKRRREITQLSIYMGLVRNNTVHSYSGLVTMEEMRLIYVYGYRMISQRY